MPTTRIVLDELNNKNWSSIATTFDDDGKIVEQVKTFDDGRITTTHFDASGAKTRVVTTDPTGIKSWSEMDQSFDTDGNLSQRKVTQDDGRVTTTSFDTNGNTTQIVKTDPTNIVGWSSITTTYSDTGTIANRVQVFDDGRVKTSTYRDDGSLTTVAMTDPNDARNWSEITINYGEDGVETSRTVTYDDGRVVTTPEPPAVTWEWTDFTGEGQFVVVIDSGYSTAYDQSNLVESYDFSGSNDSNAIEPGTDSHGSWVASVATMVANGINIIQLKVFGDNEPIASGYDIDEALDYAITLADTYDIAAVNLSLGAGNTTNNVITSLSDEFAALDDMDILVSVAAGNAGATYPEGISYIAANDNVVAVSAVDDNDRPTSWTQADDELTDIFADGTNWAVPTLNGSTYYVSGTSFAAPEISGITALLQEASLKINNAKLSDEEILQIMQDSGRAVVGYEDSGYQGYAVADAEAALTYFIDNSANYVDDFVIA